MCPSTDKCHHATRVLLPIAILLLAGCATAPAPVVEGPDDEPIVAEQPPASDVRPEAPPPDTEEARTYALPDETPTMDPSAPLDAPPPGPPPAPPASQRPANPAVVALIDAAAAQAKNGDADQAAATLERALRIEPSNATLWHRLAVLRMQQGRYEQAMELAMRSNSLARGDARLTDANRQVLEQCRAALARTSQG